MVDEAAAPSVSWDPDVDDELLCVDVHDETHDVRTFTLVSPAGKLINFKAGQYFAFETNLGGSDETRCYSMTSSPHRRNAVSITVKRVAGGRMSNWLHDSLKPGRSIRANGPLGQFARPVGADRKFLFLSGGSGITPVMSMAREMADDAGPVDVLFLHAGRTPADLVFRADLSNIANRLKGFRLFFLPSAATGEPSWPSLVGRISKKLFELVLPDVAERVVMCCGPAPFMAAARSICLELGVPPTNFIEESFDAAVVVDAPQPLIEEARNHAFSVEFARQNRFIDVAAEQTVLAAARKAGMRLPASCANGLCGTCKSKLVSGSVDMKHNGGIRQREIDAGFFLPCCSKPLSNLVVDR